jgi:hypothetical protein
MIIRLLEDVGVLCEGDTLEVDEIVPHGGNYDDSRQFVVAGVYIPESKAVVLYHEG